LELKNEFAKVSVEQDNSGNGPRLKIQDVHTGKTVFLDPLELEGLAWARHEDLNNMMNPSLGRWSDGEQGKVGRLLGTVDIDDAP
jgi:hypothetical protein